MLEEPTAPAPVVSGSAPQRRIAALAWRLLHTFAQSHRRQLLTALSLFSIAAAAATAARADEFAADGEAAEQVKVTWRATLGDKVASGTSRTLEWSRLALAGGDSQVRFLVPIASFSSGDDAQDARVRAALDSARHPYLVIEGLVHGARFDGTVTLHGITRPLGMALDLSQRGPTLTTRAAFALDVREFGVSPAQPCSEVAFDLFARLPANPQVVISGGMIASR